jgi:hypothetical protein
MFNIGTILNSDIKFEQTTISVQIEHFEQLIKTISNNIEHSV